MDIEPSEEMVLAPRGNAGREFISEMTRLINLFVRKTIWSDIALRLVLIFTPLMLQTPSRNSRAKDNKKYLEKRLKTSVVEEW